VIGTASASKHAYLRGLGAIPTTYGPGLVERVRRLAPNGVDAALDLAGADVIPDLIELVGVPSRVVSVADFTAPQYGAQGSFEVQKNPELALAKAGGLYCDGAFRVTLQKTFALAQAAEAYKLSAAGHVTGKLVITVSS
jgi:NADPH:quinone reductase-like Zn-dependent oxidoreductase